MKRASSTQRPALEVFNRPGGGLGEPGPSGSPIAGEALTDSVLLRPDEVATVLRIGRTRTFELLGSGDLPVVRIGRVVRIPKAGLDRWIDEHTTIREP
jgi:excisionase family DNA binding protein